MIQEIQNIVERYDGCVTNVDIEVDSSPVLYNIGDIVVTMEAYFKCHAMLCFTQDSEVVASTLVEYESLPLEILKEIAKIIPE